MPLFTALTRHIRRPSPSARIWLLNLAVGLLVLVLFDSLRGIDAPAGPLSMPWWALAAAFVVAELCVVHVHFRRSAHSFTLGEIPLVIGLVFAAPVDVMTAWVVGSGLVLVRARPQPIRLAFNVVNFALTAAFAGVVFHAVAGDAGAGTATVWMAAALGAILSSPIAATLVAVAMTLSGETFEARRTASTVAMAVLVSATNSSLGLAVVAVLAAEPWAALLLIAPTGALFVAYRAYTSERAQHLSLEFLYEANRTFSQAREAATGLAGVLTMSLETFRAEIAEVCVLPIADSDDEGEEKEGASRVTVGPDQQLKVMEPVAEGVADQLQGLFAAEAGARHLVADEVGGPLGAHLSGMGVKEAMIAALPGDKELVGTIMVANRLGTGKFEKKDRRLFETLAVHTGSALSEARLARHVTELRETKDHLYHQAFHDALTGLPNRLLFFDRVKHALTRRGGNVVLIYIDLNDFKPINDTYGHDAGDLILRAAADRLRDSLRAADTPARLGGDEFAVLLLDVPAADVSIVTDRILANLAEPVDLGDVSPGISASLGVAIAESGSMSAEELIRNADTAMYVAKRSGKQGVTA